MCVCGDLHIAGWAVYTRLVYLGVFGRAWVTIVKGNMLFDHVYTAQLSLFLSRNNEALLFQDLGFRL